MVDWLESCSRHALPYVGLFMYCLCWAQGRCYKLLPGILHRLGRSDSDMGGCPLQCVNLQSPLTTSCTCLCNLQLLNPCVCSSVIGLQWADEHHILVNALLRCLFPVLVTNKSTDTSYGYLPALPFPGHLQPLALCWLGVVAV